MAKEHSNNEYFQQNFPSTGEEEKTVGREEITQVSSLERDGETISFEVLTKTIEQLNILQKEGKKFMALSDFEQYVALQRMEFQMGRISQEELNRITREAQEEYHTYCMAVYLVHIQQKSARAVRKTLQSGHPKLETWVGKDRRWPHRFRYMNNHKINVDVDGKSRPYFAYILGLYTAMFSYFVQQKKKLPGHIGFSGKKKEKLQQIVKAIHHVTGDTPQIRSRREADGSLLHMAHYDNLRLNAMVMECTQKMDSIPETYILTKKEKVYFIQGLLGAGYGFNAWQQKKTGQRYLRLSFGMGLSPHFREDVCLLLESLGIYVSPHAKEIDICSYANIQKVLELHIIKDPAHIQIMEEHVARSKKNTGFNTVGIYQEIQKIIQQHPTMPIKDVQQIIQERLKISLLPQTIKQWIQKPPKAVLIYQGLQQLKKIRRAQKKEITDHQEVRLKGIDSKTSLNEELPEDHQQNILGIYEKQIREIPLLTVEEEKEIGRILQEGTGEAKQEAKRKLVRSNLRFVLMMAKKNKYGNRLDLLDIIQAGNMGLMEAAEKFDPTYNNRFITYAIYWIRQAMQKHFQDHGSTIRLPTYLRTLSRTMRKIQEHYWAIHGRDPTREELAHEMNITPQEVYRLQHIPRYIQDHSPHDEQTTPLMDQIQAPISEVQGIDIEFFRTSRAKIIMHIIHEALVAKERIVLTLHFGLDGNTEKTLQEIGAILHMTREGIRLIEIRALRKLRKRYPQIRDFIES